MDSKKLLMTTGFISLVIVSFLIVVLFNFESEPKVKTINLKFEDNIVCSTIASNLSKQCVDNSINLTQTEIDDYTELTLQGKINSLKGIENFINLKSLTILNSVNLNNIMPLNNLVKLEHLIITTDGSVSVLYDITSLANLTNLKTLDISNSNVSDVSALSSLTNLRSLNITNTNVYDVNSINRNVKIEKNELYFDVNVSQIIDNTLIYLGQTSDDFIVDGPCIIDENYNMNYDALLNEDRLYNQCIITTPDNFITLEYNLINY